MRSLLARFLLLSLISQAQVTLAQVLFHADHFDKLGFYLTIGSEPQNSQYVIILEGHLQQSSTWEENRKIHTKKVFETALSTIPSGSKVILFLNLVGGRSDVISEIRQLFLEAQFRLTTKLTGGYVCYSACIGLYMLGQERLAEPEAKFGFHQSVKKLKDGSIIRENSRQSKRHLIGWGVDPDWVESLRKKRVFNKLAMTVFDAESPGLVGSGVVTGLSDPRTK